MQQLPEFPVDWRNLCDLVAGEVQSDEGQVSQLWIEKDGDGKIPIAHSVSTEDLQEGDILMIKVMENQVESCDRWGPVTRWSLTLRKHLKAVPPDVEFP